MPEFEDSFSTSTSFLQHVRSGETLAWNRFVNIYTPLIKSWCRRFGMKEDELDDISQNVFVAVQNGIGRFSKDGTECSFRAWLWTITHSKIMDQKRSARKNPIVTGGQDSLAFEATAYKINAERNSNESANELMELATRALSVIRQDFSEKTWTAFWLTAAMGQPPSEVARELEMTSAAVCMCRARVLRRLRETIDFT